MGWLKLRQLYIYWELEQPLRFIVKLKKEGVESIGLWHTYYIYMYEWYASIWVKINPYIIHTSMYIHISTYIFMHMYTDSNYRAEASLQRLREPIVCISSQFLGQWPWLVVWNWPWCEYLHHGNQQRQQTRSFVFVFPESCLINIHWYPLYIININYLWRRHQRLVTSDSTRKGEWCHKDRQEI